jgi:hypothetical protein
MSLGGAKMRRDLRNETWVFKLTLICFAPSRRKYLRSALGGWVHNKEAATRMNKNKEPAKKQRSKGGQMTRQDEIALVNAWISWKAERVVEDNAYIEFFDEQVRSDPRFKGTHIFEVLDVLVNSADSDRRESA